MKRFLALAVLAASGVSQAADRAIYDLQYLPKAGRTYGVSTISFIDRTLETSNQDTNLSGYQIWQAVGHAMSDQVSLEASLNYSHLSRDVDGGAKSDAAKGVSDPTITSRYRLMDETYRWDLLGGATISRGDAEVDSDRKNNNLQGGHSVFVGTQHGKKHGDYQWAITGLWSHYLKSTVKDDDGPVDQDAHNSFLFRGEVLNKLAEKSFLRSSILINFAGGYEDDESTKIASSTTYQAGIEYQHLISSDLLLRAGVDSVSVKTLSGQIDSYDGFNFVLGANYQF